MVQANRVEVTSQSSLDQQVQKSRGSLQLMVRDVRTGRDVPVDVELGAIMRDRVERTSLGVKTELAFFGGKAALKIVSVAKDSPAQRAELEPGWLILSADGRELPSPESLAQAEQEARDELVLRIVDPKTRNERTVRANLR